MSLSPSRPETQPEDAMHTISWLTDSQKHPLSVAAYPTTAREASQDVPAQTEPPKQNPCRTILVANRRQGPPHATVGYQKPNCQYQVAQQGQCSQCSMMAQTREATAFSPDGAVYLDIDRLGPYFLGPFPVHWLQYHLAKKCDGDISVFLPVSAPCCGQRLLVRSVAFTPTYVQKIVRSFLLSRGFVKPTTLPSSSDPS